jgi:hypothetical protein
VKKAWQYQSRIVYWEYGNRKKKVNKKIGDKGVKVTPRNTNKIYEK